VESRSASFVGASVREALSSRVFWTLIAVVFGSMLALNSVIVHLAALLTDRGVTPGQAALAVSTMGAASFLGRLMTGWLLDRFMAVHVAFVLLVISALGTFLLTGVHAFPVSLAAAALIGFGTGGETDVVPYLVSRYFGLRSLSTLYGLHWTAWGLAGAVGPRWMGRAFDATGSYDATLVALSFATLGVAALLLSLPAYANRVPRPAAAG
jgi:MFS family permease